MKLRYFKMIMVFTGLIAISSCKKLMDINKDPDRILATSTVYPQLLTSAEVNLGFEGGSDLFRYATLIMQQMSGLASSPNQTYEYSRYNITGSDENNVWGNMFANTLSDLELVIKQATAAGSLHYAGVAKILKAYEYSLIVDTWGNVPYTETQQQVENTQPHYDDASAIYPKLITLLTEAINDVSASTSLLSPGTNSTIYSNASFATSRPFWIKLANTLKLRLLLHYSKKDPAFCVAQITTLVNASGTTFLSSNTDNFSHPFYSVANQRNSIETFERNRAGYLFADQQIVGMMNTKSDPRRPFYFTDYPFGSGLYVGISAANPPASASATFSRVHTFLRGAILTGTTPPFTYTGAAPQRMITFAEYNFIRAEAALMGAPGDPQAFFTAGITASMQEVGVSAANIATYLAANGTLIGTNAQKLQQIIEEKYIALFGVSVEPWTDWRRTGYPVLTPPTNRLASVTAVPRTLFYPQSEIDLNPNHPAQKNVNLQDKVFWDN
jgi:Starch-binding associating with outer membrane